MGASQRPYRVGFAGIVRRGVTPPGPPAPIGAPRWVYLDPDAADVSEGIAGIASGT
jgi:hypothetical protein